MNLLEDAQEGRVAGQMKSVALALIRALTGIQIGRT